MALVVPGMMCPLCERPMNSRADVIMFAPFVANRRDPIHLFSDGVFHRECFARHPLADAVAKRFDEVRRETAPGNRRCVVCGQEITRPDEHFGAGHLTDDPSNPLWAFNYVQLHRSHFKQWAYAAEFQRLVEALMASEAWDGPRIVFEPAPMWRLRE